RTDRLLKANTLKQRLHPIRSFLLGMARKRHESLSTISPREAQKWIRQSYIDCKRGPATKRTVKAAITAIRDLHILQTDLGMGLVLEPFPGKFEKTILSKARDSKAWEAPPKVVCEALLHASLRLMEEPAEDLIRIVHKYA